MNKIKTQKGITMIALVITVIILLILTNVLVYNAQDSVYIKKINNLYNDIEQLREKVSDYYNEYGKIPANIKYTNLSSLSDVISSKNDTGDFYVIDLEAMNGISLNYGKDYQYIKNNKDEANSYTDIYIINENSHNIFYVHGVEIKEKNTVKKYYTDYIVADDSVIDLRYVENIKIPDGFYYIGKTEDSDGKNQLVISNNKEEKVDMTKENQYTWVEQKEILDEIPDNIKLEDNQKKYEFLNSVSIYNGYFKNKDGKVQYAIINENKWSEEYSQDSQYVDKDGENVIIPKGCRISLSPTMNSIKKGLVIKDKNDNEWIWIPIPESVFKTTVNQTDYENIENDLKLYAIDYSKNTGTQNFETEDKWYQGCGLTEDEYNNLYKTMLSSIYKNNGFWIARYEAGIEGTDKDSSKARIQYTAITDLSPKAVSQKDMIPYNYITCSDAQKLAKAMADNSEKTSSLMFGIQWDLVCKILEENTKLAKEDINSNSSAWGNYSNVSYDITSENAKKYQTTWSSMLGTKEKNELLLSTASSEYTKMMNIYDFAGNEWEWTLEYAINNGNVLRGGAFANLGNVNSASSRGMNTQENSIYYTFRAVLY
ncbi:MAG: type II secretion system protein [Clostridia bacterium]